MDLKRLSDGDEPQAKRAAIPTNGPINPDSLEEFQKDAIFRQMKDYRRQRDELQQRLDALESANSADEALKGELERVTEQYLAVSKQLERLESPAVANILPEGLKKTSSNGDASGKDPDSKDSVKQEPSAAASELEAQIQVLKEELSGSEAACKKSNDQLAAGEAKILQLEKQLRDLDAQLTALPDERLREYAFVKHAERLIQDLTVDNSRLEQDLARRQEALSAVQAEQAMYEQQVRDKYDTQVKETERKLDQAEADVARIRAARDDILGELTVRKATDPETAKQIATLKSALELSEERVKSAERGEEPVVSEEVDGKTPEELRELCAKLMKQNKVFAAEIPSLEKAFSQAHARAKAKALQEQDVVAKVALLTSSKAKADEKYFSAMRSRDALAAEHAKVKQALAKSAEVVNSLKAEEQKLVSAAARAQRQLADAEAKAQQLQRQLAHGDRRRTELESHLSSATKQIQKLQSQLGDRDADLQSARAGKAKLEQQVEKLDKQVATKRATSGLGSAEGIQEQLDSLRSIAICPVCNVNWKDTAIQLCGHVFCRECLDRRMAARMRKCPVCNCNFGASNLLPVHL